MNSIASANMTKSQDSYSKLASMYESQLSMLNNQMNADLDSMKVLHDDVAKSYNVQLSEMNKKVASGMEESNQAYHAAMEAYTGDMMAINEAMMDKLNKFQDEHTKIVANYEKSLSDMMAKVNKSIEEETKANAAQGGAYGKMQSAREAELEAVIKKEIAVQTEQMNKILEMIELQALNNQIGGIGLKTPSIRDEISNVLDQKVEISASFPSVQDRNELEEAFNNLINKASQYAGRDSSKSSKKKK